MKKTILAIVTMSLLVFSIIPVFAQGAGTIRMEPHGSYYPEPVMLDSPATFNVSVQSGGDPTCDPHVLLVMTTDCYNSLTDMVTVNWTNSVDLTIQTEDWTKETENGNKVPSGVPIHSGVGYTVAALKDHLNTSDPIFWAFKPILDSNPLTQDKQEFTVALPSTNARMLVYVMGKNAEYTDAGAVDCPDSEADFDNRVPPTQPGFVVPELATILLATASFAGLGLYALTKRQKKQ